ncbi:hypothetical protein C8Q74DRAFT_1261848 [Fomes fomentarius]|nr:hypothetical protein C8Q74DRAFT_1261848 [Fomes fomentarius]
MADSCAHLVDPAKDPQHPSSTFGTMSGSVSSSAKLPHHSSGTTATPSSQPSRLSSETPATSSSPPDCVKSPRPFPAVRNAKHVPFAVAATSLQAQARAPALAHAQPTSSSSSLKHSAGSQRSDDEMLPTRASIRAWAKATLAGPPRDTPSPTMTALIQLSVSDEDIDRKSITHSAGHLSPTLSPSPDTSSGNSSGDEDNSGSGSGHAPLTSEGSGNVADIESAGSGSDMPSSSPLLLGSSDPPLSTSLPSRPTTMLLQGAAQIHSSSSESLGRTIFNVHGQEQQARIDRRGNRHPSGRRRHRERERERDRRSRASNPTTPLHATQVLPPQGQSPATQARRLTVFPQSGLSLPPPRLRPLRLLQTMGPTMGGLDVLDEITRMLQSSRGSLIRSVADIGDHRYGSMRLGREDDVLDDISLMIQMQTQGK